MHGQQNIKKIASTMLTGWFLDTFAKVRKATVSFVIRLSVCLSVWNNSVPIGRIFVKFYI